MIKISLTQENVNFLQEILNFTPVVAYDIPITGCPPPVTPSEFAIWAGNRLSGKYSFHSGLGVLAFESDQDAVLFILDFGERFR